MRLSFERGPIAGVRFALLKRRGSSTHRCAHNTECVPLASLKPEATWELEKPNQGSSFTKQGNLIENKSYLQKECNLYSVSGEDRLSTSCARASFYRMGQSGKAGTSESVSGEPPSNDWCWVRRAAQKKCRRTVLAGHWAHAFSIKYKLSWSSY